MLTATLRPIDHQRVKRLVIAWHDGDKLAADAALTEAMGDPIGTPGLVFGLATFDVELATRLGLDDAVVAGLRDDLLDDASDTEGNPGTGSSGLGPARTPGGSSTDGARRRISRAARLRRAQ